MEFDGSISGYLSLDCTLRALDIIVLDSCLVIVFIWGFDTWIMMFDYLDYDVAFFFLCFIAIFVWDIDMLIIY